MTTKEFNKCLRMIQNGNVRGMEILYNYYYEKLFLTVDLEIKNKDISADIVSGVLASVFINAKNYTYIEKPNAWIYQSARFALINYKKQNAKYVYTEYIDNGYSACDTNIDLKLTLKQAVEKLTKRQQEIFQLRYIYDMKISEVADMMGISSSTLSREIEIIKKELKFLMKDDNFS